MRKSQSLLTLKITALAIHLSVLIYVFIVFFLAKTQPWENLGWGGMIKPEHEILLYVLMGLAGVMVFLTIMVPQLFASKDPQVSKPQSAFFDFNNFTPKIYTQTILRLAFAESIAIFGFVLAFQNQSPWLIVPFAAVSLILQVAFAPWMTIRG